MTPCACANATVSQTRRKTPSRSRQIALRRHPAIEAIAADALHRVEQPAVGQLAEVVDRHDAGMLEPREDPRLVGFVRRALDDLERDLAVEHGVARQVDDAHAAAPEDRDQLVARAGDVGTLEHRGQAIERRLGNHPRQRPRLGLELLVARALFAQRLEHEPAELAARGGQLVGDVGRRQAEPARQLGVGRAIAIVRRQVVLLEDGEPIGASPRRARVAQPIRGAGKEAAQPLAVKVGVEVVDEVGRPGAGARAPLRRSRSGSA